MILDNIITALTILSLIVIINAIILNLRPVKAYLKAKLDSEHYNSLNQVTRTAVEWAEQWLKNSTGAEKKAIVVKYIVDKVTENGWNVTEEDVDMAIESACLELKKAV